MGKMRTFSAGKMGEKWQISVIVYRSAATVHNSRLKAKMQVWGGGFESLGAVPAAPPGALWAQNPVAKSGGAES